jgi:hypothetical protein
MLVGNLPDLSREAQVERTPTGDNSVQRRIPTGRTVAKKEKATKDAHEHSSIELA